MLYVTVDKIGSCMLQKNGVPMILILHLQRVPNAREVVVPARAPETDLSLGSIVACQPNIGGYGGNEREKELENHDAPNLPQNWEMTSENDRDMATQTGTTEDAEEESYDSQKIMEEMAATKAQAAFRGYLVIFSSGVNEVHH